ncbi:hypothetical protein GCM10025880_14770 [Methylorubrum aminovorans]|nr:hypothetical protein GCM10025880_14770 [Methylorubrum aminovorans]
MHVADRHEPHEVTDLRAPQTLRVAGPVEALVMVAYDVEDVGPERGLPGQQVGAERGVGAHHRHLFDRERARLVEDGLGDQRLADIVQERGLGQALPVGSGESEFGGEGGGEARHAQGVLVDLDVVAPDEVEPGADADLGDRVEHDLRALLGLRGSRRPAGGGAVEQIGDEGGGPLHPHLGGPPAAAGTPPRAVARPPLAFPWATRR